VLRQWSHSPRTFGGIRASTIRLVHGPGTLRNPEFSAMDSSVFESSLRVFFEAFAENDKTQRIVLLSRCMSEGGEIWGPQRLFKGYEAISEKIEGFYSRMPGARLVLASGLNTFLNIARFKVAIVNQDGSTRSEGDNFVEMAESGRIQRVFPFWDPVPPIPRSWPRHLAL
jgi:hypothetical protein